MPIRNPFKKSGIDVQDENRPIPRSGSEQGFQKTDVVGSKPVAIKEPVEYKLSDINDSGVYLPPSPPEKKTFWHIKSNGSSTSSNPRSVLSENEPFSISRESFDSYRRSFDISARSPIPDLESRPRQSLDSRQLRLPRASLQEQRRPEPTKEEGFEEVGLNDDVKPRKRGIFSRFGDSSEPHTNITDGRPTSGHGHTFHFAGRKRGQSGSGSELRPMSNGQGKPATDIPVESR